MKLRTLLASLLILLFGNSYGVALPLKYNVPGSFRKFDCPEIDDSNKIITASTCSGATGSITGITGMGTGILTYKWYDSENTLVSNSADLLGVAPGTYMLKLTDQSKCTAAIRSYIVTANDAVEIDDSRIKIKPSLCSKHTGSISNLYFANAVKFRWYNSDNDVVGNTPDLGPVASGLYTLVASNTSGCSTKATYNVPSAEQFPVVVKVDTTSGICRFSSGTLTLTLSLQPTDPVFTFAVLSPIGSVVKSGAVSYDPTGPSKISFDADEGNALYSVVVSDPNYCSSVIGRYSLSETQFVLISDKVVILNDKCGRNSGRISNLSVKGGTPPQLPLPQQWTWTDSLGNVVGRLPDLSNVGKGTYSVYVKDLHGCVTETKSFKIADNTTVAIPPVVQGTTVCLPSQITLSVQNPDTKLIYRLYDSTQTAITENNNGVFSFFASKTAIYYISTVDVLCESDKTPVTVTVIAPGVIIPNTFTPNNDGINDYWTIPHISDFPGAEVSIFDRNGRRVYHSINYGHPFDGRYGISRLPNGVYYYVIDLKKPECLGKVSGSLTLIR